MKAGCLILVLLAPALQTAQTPPKLSEPPTKGATDAPAPKPAEAPPKDVASILEAKSLPETKMYFETLKDGKPIGYRVSTLTPVKGEGSVAYEYSAESTLVMETGMRVEGVVISRLKRNFEPVSISNDRELDHPAAPTRRISDRVEVGETEVKIAREDTVGSAQDPQSFPKPKEPFVFGMEFVIDAMDVNKNAALPVAELKPQEMGVAVYRVTRGSKTDEGQEMVLQRADGSVGYRFITNAEGRIESWAEGGTPLMMKRCTEEHFKEVVTKVNEKK